jgi:AraC-like DNA-binding protein
MIRDGKNKVLTLEAIGQLSGFSSRNTFFIAFKQAEGISPSEYAKRLTEQS